MTVNSLGLGQQRRTLVTSIKKDIYKETTTVVEACTIPTGSLKNFHLSVMEQSHEDLATENHAYDLARLDHRTNNEHFDNDEDEEDERMQVEDENETDQEMNLDAGVNEETYKRIVIEKFNRLKKLMHLLRAKPPAEAIKEAGVTIEEFQHFQSMIMKSQAAAVVAANVSNRQINTEPCPLPLQASRWPVPFLHQSQNSCNYDECENEDELQEQENAQNYQNSSERSDLPGPSTITSSSLPTPTESIASSITSVPPNMNNAAAAFMFALSKMNGVTNNTIENIQSTARFDVSNFFNRQKKFSQPPNFGSAAFTSTGQLQHSLQDYQGDPETEVDSITAGTVSSGVGSIKRGTLPPTSFHQEVYDKYITKFTASNPCNQQLCPHRNREHYHCIDNDCNYQRFTNKSDVKRHYNMHKKRDNSLLHGFMRFAPSDECRAHFNGPCMYNGKSTHYHCLHSGCSKVYTSTSDVMTHKKFHIKDEELAKNGFQRYRATDCCEWDDCQFNDMRTTHFHCTREGCRFRFKNKCEMEKHKSYHIKDDNYTRQGFKKFYKNEMCPFKSCQWNQKTNHFHCLRPNCTESFSSTNQAISHKRKHERESSTSTTNCLTAIRSDLLQENAPQHQGASFSSTRFEAPISSSPSSLKSNNLESTRPLLTRPITTPNTPVVNEYSKSESPSHQPVQIVQSSDLGLSSLASNNIERSTGCELNPNTLMACPVSVQNNAQVDKTADNLLARNLNQKESLPLQMLPKNCKNKSQEKHANDPINLSTQQNHSAVEITSNIQNSSEYSYILTVSQKIDKYFRGYGAHTCVSLTPCEHFQTSHYHCMIEGCCAVFTNKNLVFTHTKYHYKLEQLGLEQVIASQYRNNETANHSTRSSTPSTSSQDAFMSSQRSNSCEAVCNDLDEDNLNSNCELTTKMSSKEAKNEDNQNQFSDAPPNYDIAMKNLSAVGNIQMNKTMIQSQTNNLLIYNNQSADSHNKNCSTPPITSCNVSVNRVHQTPVTSNGKQSTPNQLDLYFSLQNASRNNKLQQNAHQVSSSENKNDQSYYNDERCNGIDESFIQFKVSCAEDNCQYSQESHWHCPVNNCNFICKSHYKALSHKEAHSTGKLYSDNSRNSLNNFSSNNSCSNSSCEFKMQKHFHCLKEECGFICTSESQFRSHIKSHSSAGLHSDIEVNKQQQYPHHDSENELMTVVVDKDEEGDSMELEAGSSGNISAETPSNEEFKNENERQIEAFKQLKKLISTNLDASRLNRSDILHLIQRQSLIPLFGNQPSVEMQQFYQHCHQVQMVNLKRQEEYEKASRRQESINETSNKIHENGDRVPLNKDGPVDLSKGTMSSDEKQEVNGRRWSTGASCVNDSKIATTGSSDDDTTSLPAAFSARVINSEIDITPKLPPTSYNKPAGRTEITSDGHMFTSYRLNNKLPEGFIRYEASDDCQDYRCSFRKKAPHFHCTRPRCGYRFVGRSHIGKHQTHHQRVASLERNDFKRYKMNQDCCFDECQYRLKNTHFHCLRCSFVCSDSAKVTTHRKAHDRSDELQQYNFERFKGVEDCGRSTCKYRYKNMSHYHCQRCEYTVVGMSSISSHYSKHKHNNALAQVCTKTNQEIEKLHPTNPTTSTPSEPILHQHPSIFHFNSELTPTSNFNLSHYPQMVYNLKREPNSAFTIPFTGAVTTSIPLNFTNPLVTNDVRASLSSNMGSKELVQPSNAGDNFNQSPLNEMS